MSSPYTEFINEMKTVEKDPVDVIALIWKTIRASIDKKVSDPNAVYFDQKYHGNSLLLFLEEFLQMMNHIYLFHSDLNRFFKDEKMLCHPLSFYHFEIDDLKKVFCGEKDILTMTPSEFICEMYGDKIENYDNHRICELGDHISFIITKQGVSVGINFFRMLLDYVIFYSSYYKFIRSNNREIGLLELI